MDYAGRAGKCPAWRRAVVNGPHIETSWYELPGRDNDNIQPFTRFAGGTFVANRLANSGSLRVPSPKLLLKFQVEKFAPVHFSKRLKSTRWHDLLGQALSKRGLPVQWPQLGIDADPIQIWLVFGVGRLQPSHRLVNLAQREIDQPNA
jgi:hypothetical protein